MIIKDANSIPPKALRESAIKQGVINIRRSLPNKLNLNSPSETFPTLSRSQMTVNSLLRTVMSRVATRRKTWR